MLKKIRLIGMLLPLLAILGISVYIALQNQDIRNRAGSVHEFIQMTEARLLKHRLAIARVVVNNLQPHLFYRLVISVSYSPNPDFPPPAGMKPPPDKRRTMRIKDNKTYPFLYRLSNCYYVPTISVRLYSREIGKKYAEIPNNGMVTTTQLKPPCATTTVQPTSIPDQQTQQQSSESGSQIQNTETPKPVQITNGDIPDDAGDEPTDNNAVDIDSVEDVSVMDAESSAAAQEIASTPQTTVSANQLTATSGTTVFEEGQTTYDCSNPSSVTRHVHVSLVPKGSVAKLKVTSYVDVYTPKIPERTIYENIVHDGDIVAVTMSQTPPSGFGNVFFATTLYFADSSFYSYGGGANVGWTTNCTTKTSTTNTLLTTTTTSPSTIQGQNNSQLPVTSSQTSITPRPTTNNSQPTSTISPTSPSTIQGQNNPQPTFVPPSIIPTSSQLALVIPTSTPTQPTSSFNSISNSPTPINNSQFSISNSQTTSTPQPSTYNPQPTVNPSSPTPTQGQNNSQTTSPPLPTTFNVQPTTQNTQQSQVSFGSISNPTVIPTTATNKIVTPTLRSTTQFSQPTTIQPTTSVSPTSIPPLADFAGRAQAETNATPTPFPIFYPAVTTTPSTLFGKLAMALPGQKINSEPQNQTSVADSENPLVPQVPTQHSFSLFGWLLSIFQGVYDFFVMVINVTVQTVRGFFPS